MKLVRCVVHNMVPFICCGQKKFADGSHAARTHRIGMQRPKARI